MNDETRAVIFGRDAVEYEKSRPTYPAEAVEHILSLVEARRALEIGAGTGKATEAFARPDLALTCLEPSAEMAEVLGAKTLPGVEVQVTTFEDWRSDGAPYDLVYAAQAWHWVDHTTGYDRARAMLRPGGVLALMWNIPNDRYDTFEDVYARHAPGLLRERDERIHKRDSHTWLEEIARSGFARPELFAFKWSVDLDGAGLRSLYSTYSDHMMLPEAIREPLLVDLEKAVSERGGSIVLEYETHVFSGQV